MENSVLTGVQAQWLRMHNFFAQELVKIRPDWRSSDNTLFEEARKVLSALHQRYVYEDWLPKLIGKNMAEKFFGDSRGTSQYDPSVKSSTRLSFDSIVVSSLGAWYNLQRSCDWCLTFTHICSGFS